jgi:hypothetical protein
MQVQMNSIRLPFLHYGDCCVCESDHQQHERQSNQRTVSCLADSAIITVNSNKLQANYEGGDGNDLALTVLP